MKKRLLNIIHKMQLWVVLKSNSRELIIYDIDNTIADTWRYIKPGARMENSTFLSLPMFPAFADKLKLEIANPNCQVLFFTVRPIRSWMTTMVWLKRNGIQARWQDIFLFASAAHKVDLLSLLATTDRKITFLDDMSYNHENGETKFFVAEIERLKNINLSYIGSEIIIKLQQKIY